MNSKKFGKVTSNKHMYVSSTSAAKTGIISALITIGWTLEEEIVGTILSADASCISESLKGE